MSDEQSDKSSAAAARLGIRKVDGKHEFDHKSLIESMGGLQGILESLVPGLIFVTLFSIFTNATAAVIASAVSSVLFIVARIIAKKPLTQAISGLVGIGIASFLAFRQGGESRDYFITGFITNLTYLVPLVISVLIRWPLIGLLAGLLLGEKTTWRRNKRELRVFTAATLIWVGVFAARLLVQWPLYLSNNLAALGIARLIMGLPLYAAALWLTWLMLRGVIRRRS